MGSFLFYVMQAATALILYTGANTSFNGFPFLASFVAADRFLPRQLTRRGHRLVFSNAIIVLALLASVLLVVTRAKVNDLVPFYAIGVFTGFAMAGFGMAKHYSRTRDGHWRRSIAINLTSGITCAIVVAIFAIAKFTEGAWVVVIVFPVMVVRPDPAQPRIPRGGGDTRFDPPGAARLSQPNFARHVVLLSRERARPGGRGRSSIRPDAQGDSSCGRSHFALDIAAARRLEEAWEADRVRSCRWRSSTSPTGGSAGRRSSWSPARRHRRARTSRCCCRGAASRRRWEGCCTTARRTRSRAVVSRVPNAAATIVPFDTVHFDQSRPARLSPRRSASAAKLVASNGRPHPLPDIDRALGADLAPGHDPIGALRSREPATVHGRIRSVRIQPLADSPVLVCELVDATGGVELLFYGRRSIPGLATGAVVTAKGRTMSHHGRLAMANPRYELEPD